jgi:predicted PolB exonuclease-like 3'-5' exonuclease
VATTTLLLELVLRTRGAGTPAASTALQLEGAYAVELDGHARRRGSHRFAIEGAPIEGETRCFPDEGSLLRELAALIGKADGLVTAQGRQLDIPALETLALRHAVELPGQFNAEDPYQARHSPYNVAGHLDLANYLADGDRRLRGLSLELLVPLIFPGASPPPRRSLEKDSLPAARQRAFYTYLLLLRVQRLRGVLSSGDVRARLGELKTALLEPSLSALAEPAPWCLEPTPAPATQLTDIAPGLLAFDIETVLDIEGLARCLGKPVEDPAAALAELVGAPTEFAPAPLHKVVAVALCHWDPKSDRVELARLRLDGPIRAGGPLLSEADLLATFWSLAAGQRLVSYNGKRFDLPVLLYRSLPHPLEVGWFLAERRPPADQYRHPQSRHQLDLFDQLGGGLSPGKLGDLLQTIGLPGKIGPAGADVQALWSSGKGDAVGDYCLQDAAQTLLLGLRFLQVAGELSAEAAQRAALAAKARFAQEPALDPILAGGKGYFGER